MSELIGHGLQASESQRYPATFKIKRWEHEYGGLYMTKRDFRMWRTSVIKSVTQPEQPQEVAEESIEEASLKPNIPAPLERDSFKDFNLFQSILDLPAKIGKGLEKADKIDSAFHAMYGWVRRDVISRFDDIDIKEEKGDKRFKHRWGSRLDYNFRFSTNRHWVDWIVGGPLQLTNVSISLDIAPSLLLERIPEFQPYLTNGSKQIAESERRGYAQTILNLPAEFKWHDETYKHNKGTYVSGGFSKEHWFTRESTNVRILPDGSIKIELRRYPKSPPWEKYE